MRVRDDLALALERRVASGAVRVDDAAEHDQAVERRRPAARAARARTTSRCARRARRAAARARPAASRRSCWTTRTVGFALTPSFSPIGAAAAPSREGTADARKRAAGHGTALHRVGIDVSRDRRDGRDDAAAGGGGHPLRARRRCSRSRRWRSSVASTGMPSAAEVRGAAIVGVWLLIGGVGIVTITESHAPSNLTAVLASTAALWVVGYRALAGERIGRGSIAAATLGIVGVIVLLSPSISGAGTPWLLGALAAALLWSSGSFYGRRLTVPADPFVSAVVQMLTAGVVMMIGAVVLDGFGALDLIDRVDALAARAALPRRGRRASRSPPTSGRSAGCRSRRSSRTSTSIRRSRSSSARSSSTRASASPALIGTALVIAAVFATVRTESSPSPGHGGARRRVGGPRAGC